MMQKVTTETYKTQNTEDEQREKEVSLVSSASHCQITQRELMKRQVEIKDKH